MDETRPKMNELQEKHLSEVQLLYELVENLRHQVKILSSGDGQKRDAPSSSTVERFNKKAR